MTQPKFEISSCCNAPVRAEWGDDFAHESKLKEPPRGVTVWRVCTTCQKACDTHPNVMDIGGKKCKPMSTFSPTKDFAGGWAEEQNWEKQFKLNYQDEFLSMPETMNEILEFIHLEISKARDEQIKKDADICEKLKKSANTTTDFFTGVLGGRDDCMAAIRKQLSS